MRVLVVNPGSSTLKVRLLGDDDEILADRVIDPWDGGPVALGDEFAGADAVGFRVVHGGSEFTAPVRLDDGVMARIEALTPLAPLHQPRALAAVRAVGTPAPAVACFDTAFHATIPPAAATYALPGEWRRRWDLRRFGFHGLSHAYAARRAGAGRVVSCHLGAGASLCAVLDGRSVDTTMGFTPLEGLVMATRSGSVDPGLVLWLSTQAGMDPADIHDGLERSSGLAGLTGGSGDMRDVVAGLQAGDPAAELAFSVYVHRLRREIGAMTAALGGLDTLVFTGGVGEHQPPVRASVAEGLGFLDVAIDGSRNAATTGDGDVSAPGAPVRTLVVTAREDLEIASQVRAACDLRP